ncbi:hypothetical protein ACFLZT_04715, partial [Thermodesulfobacteriota bacterium]
GRRLNQKQLVPPMFQYRPEITQSSIFVNDMAQDIAEVNQSAREMSNSSSQVNLSAEEMSSLAVQLNDMVGKFRV